MPIGQRRCHAPSEDEAMEASEAEHGVVNALVLEAAIGRRIIQIFIRGGTPDAGAALAVGGVSRAEPARQPRPCRD